MERSLYNPQAPPGLKRRETRTQRKLRTSILGRRNIFGKVQRQEEPGGNHTSTATSHPPVSCHGPLCPNQKASRPGLAGVSFQAHRQTDELEHDRELSGHKESHHGVQVQGPGSRDQRIQRSNPHLQSLNRELFPQLEDLNGKFSDYSFFGIRLHSRQNISNLYR